MIGPKCLGGQPSHPSRWWIGVVKWALLIGAEIPPIVLLSGAFLWRRQHLNVYARCADIERVLIHHNDVPTKLPIVLYPILVYIVWWTTGWIALLFVPNVVLG
jgi:hypothetical protein